MPFRDLSKELKEDTVRYMLNSIGKYQLLSNEAEIELGRQVQAMMQMHLHPELKQTWF